MEWMTLREAARRCYRSVTTLRRYIRSGRLRADKRIGRYGPEYFVSDVALAAAGAPVDPPEDEVGRSLVPASSPLPVPYDRQAVPLGLYHELQMKHEQLLVQYGMIRATGLRVFELEGELDSRRRRVEECESEIGRLKRSISELSSRADQELRAAELELEGRALEIAALQEKVRALELLTRGAREDGSIEDQFAKLAEQARRVERQASSQRRGKPWLLREVRDPEPEA